MESEERETRSEEGNHSSRIMGGTDNARVLSRAMRRPVSELVAQRLADLAEGRRRIELWHNVMHYHHWTASEHSDGRKGGGCLPTRLSK